MRLKYGPSDTVAQQSISSKLLLQLGATSPDYMPTVMSTFVEESPILALLDAKGYKTNGLDYRSNYLLDGGRYRTVSSNHVQYKIENSDARKEHFATSIAGVTFVDSANPTQPGLNKQPFYIYLDSNWVGGNDVILLADGKTQLFVDNARGGELQPGGVYRYKVKVNGNRLDEYVDTDIIQEGFECQLVMTQHRQDFSEFGNERYTGHTFGDAYLTLQRLKYSYSGTAAAMDKNRKVSGNWVFGANGMKAFLPYADAEMLKWSARFLDFQLLEGKRSVNDDTKKVVLTDENNQEILTGDGALYSGDGPVEYPQNNGWTPKFIEAFMADIAEYITIDENGNREALMLMPQRSYINWTTAMYNMGVTADANITGEGGEKIINNTYKGFTLAGITLLAVMDKRKSQRPGVQLSDGTMSNEWDSVILPLGKTPSGQRGAELITLRPSVRGTVAGIDKGGNVSSSVDGTSEHILLQNGIVWQNQAIKIYKPLTGNIL